MIRALSVAVVAFLFALPAEAQERREVPLPGSSSISAVASAGVWAGNTFYVSGWLDPDLANHKDITSQTAGTLGDIKRLLESQGLTMGDVAMVRVYLGGELGNPEPYFRGMMAGYLQFFGTKEQPNKPARTTVQVALPAAPRGALVEIDVVAVRTGK